MQTSKQGVELIKEFEGCKLTAYQCSAGVWTIGYGSTLGITKGMAISQEEAEGRLKVDLQRFEEGVMRLVKVPLSQGQFDALVSFAFNVGLGNLQRSTLLRLLNEGDYHGAADELPKWRRAGGKILAGLVRRREAERTMFLAATRTAP